MAGTNSIGSKHLKMLVAGVLSGLPTLMVLVWVYSVGMVALPRWGAWLTLGSTVVLLLSLSIGLWGDWLMPRRKPQKNSSRLWRSGLGLTGVISISLAACLAMVWFNSRQVTGNEAVGLKLYFVHEATYFVVLLLAAICCLALWGLLVKALFHNLQESRILAGLLTFCLVLFPLALIGTFAIEMQTLPEWQILQTVSGPENYSYSLLQEHPQTRNVMPIAIARHNANNPIYSTLEIVLLEKNDSQTVFEKGTKHTDATVRAVCEKLLKGE